MNKIIAVLFILVLLLTGCVFNIDNKPKEATSKTNLTEADSKVEFKIYPDNLKYSYIGAFDRIFYNKISDTERSLYIAMDNSVYNMETGYIYLGKCSRRELETAYRALRNDRPEYFWIPTSYGLRLTDGEYYICFAEKEENWLYSRDERSLYERQIKAALTEINKEIDRGLSQFQRELYVHDRLLEVLEYDKEAIEDPKNRYYAWNILGGLIEGKAVCEGYSRTMQVISNMLGLNCGLIIGETGDSHMWNIIEIDNEWYQLDLTSDDLDKGITYLFFNVTDEYMEKGRTTFPLISDIHNHDIAQGEYNIWLPKCKSIKNNYHVQKSLYIADLDNAKSVIVSQICNAVRNKKSRVEFLISPQAGFIFGESDVERTFKLENCIALANAELSSSKTIKKYSYGGINGSTGFFINW